MLEEYSVVHHMNLIPIPLLRVLTANEKYGSYTEVRQHSSTRHSYFSSLQHCCICCCLSEDVYYDRFFLVEILIHHPVFYVCGCSQS